MTYVPIYCETQRKRDEELRDNWRSVHDVHPGRCFAKKVDGTWRCACCGKSVKVVS